MARIVNIMLFLFHSFSSYSELFTQFSEVPQESTWGVSRPVTEIVHLAREEFVHRREIKYVPWP